MNYGNSTGLNLIKPKNNKSNKLRLKNQTKIHYSNKTNCNSYHLLIYQFTICQHIMNFMIYHHQLITQLVNPKHFINKVLFFTNQDPEMLLVCTIYQF